jgi:hypothetical protein
MVIERALPVGQSIHRSRLRIFRWECTVPAASPTSSASSRTVGEYLFAAIASCSAQKTRHLELVGSITSTFLEPGATVHHLVELMFD